MNNDIVNLLEETIDYLRLIKKTPGDVNWVGFTDNNNQVSFTWEDFSALADFEYDCGFGEQKIEPTLVVVGNDWWLERYEYNGQEYWRFCSPPVRGRTIKPVISDLISEYMTFGLLDK